MEEEKQEQAFVVLMEAVDEVVGARAALSEELKKGVFNISRARYSMGDTRVGRLQYEGREMKTTACVTLRGSTQAERGEEGEGRTVYSVGRPEVVLGNEKQENSSTGDSSKLTAPSEGLRKRNTSTSTPQHTAGTSRAPHKDDAEPELTTTKKAAIPASRNTPLTWFSGGMVPPAMREAERDFSSALQEVLRLANAVSELQSAERRYRQLVVSNNK
mmetsp:Transcript_28309/g.47513  ORF Transcript_28309/g.47513 Transcript_28309/m.47513 type:complete len:216 (+) Transcript_28309:205-852(+)|eukprot:CAMPEP_0198203256 /NCGR_PEP_ID=MMETSP1445-20131203/6513_1 /TAXON_ID=36898 /ORGANISM="Pyramimonas sp., Strain CCMP2087" /LENGTH=215 /DNA_ID=CAMNT_0043874557 /DNA_START=151 /DNA_END=798 /DNA_ORIENTATION=-